MYGDHTVPGPPSREELREAYDARERAREEYQDAAQELRDYLDMHPDNWLILDVDNQLNEFARARDAYSDAFDAYDDLRAELKGWGADV